MLYCPECGANLFAKVSVENLFARMNFRVNSEKFAIDGSIIDLSTNNVKLNVEGFACSNCKAKFNKVDEVNLKCEYSGKQDLFDRFVIVIAKYKDQNDKKKSNSFTVKSSNSTSKITYSTTPNLGILSRPRIIHVDSLAKYKESLKSNPYSSKYDYDIVVEKIKNFTLENIK